MRAKGKKSDVFSYF